MAELRDIEMPQYLQNMPEFVLIKDVVDQVISDLDDEMQDRHDDILITTATETGIKRREDILGILTDPDEDLEVRRARVLFWWFSKMPYTYRVVEGKVAALCGSGNYTFDYDSDTQTLTVGINYDLGWDVVGVVYKLLDRLVMLNVILDVHAASVETIGSPLYFGAGVRACAITPVLEDNAYTWESPAYLGAGNRVYARTDTLDDDV